ncbi:MAG: sugar ABC transporter permease [Anaerocolumna sp.]
MVVSKKKLFCYSRNKKNDYFWGYLMIAPNTIGLGIFFFYPFFKTLLNSFYDTGAFNVTKWAGLSNYKKMISDTVMWQSLGNTFKYVLIIVPCTMVLSMLIAVLLNTKVKGQSVFRVLFFIPSITMTAAVAIVWKWIYNGDFGILNYMLGLVGIQAQRWLSEPRLALFSISTVSIWMGVGYNMIILLAGIQGISGSYYEAASIDGAGSFKKFLHITLPLVTPTLFFVMTTSLISAFQTFDVIYMMINSNSIALNSTQSVVLYFYRNAFVFSKKGYASAIAMLLFVIIMIITVLQMKLQKKWVNYD